MMDFDTLDEEEIDQGDAWIVIRKYFDEKSLVRQQIDSFDNFVNYTIQEIVDDSGEIRHTPENQYIANQDVNRNTYVIKFGEISVYHAPKIFEADGDGRELFPHEARLMSLTSKRG